MADAQPAERSRRRALTPVGLTVAAIGCTMPWYSVGPASTLGTATAGRWALIAIALATALVMVDRRRPQQRAIRVAAQALLGAAALLAVTAAFRVPDSMSLSLGPAVTLIGAAVAMFGAWPTLRRDLDPAPGAAGDLAGGEVPEPADIDTDIGADANTETNAEAQVESPQRSGWARVRRVGAFAAGGLAGVLLLLVFVPVSLDGLEASPEPTATYDDAVARFDALAADETGVYPPCRSRLLHHDEPTDVVVVLFHGLTNCPRQYVELGNELHEQGATVLITRAPGHGVGDDEALSGAGALRDLDAQQLAEYADDAVDIAVGLGDEVRVSGLSMGGVVALWAAQHRPDVSQVVAIAPAMELPVVPNVVSTVFTNLFNRVPTITRSHERHIDHDYAALSTRGLAATFALGQAVADEGLESPAVVTDLVVMLNPDDPLVVEDEVATLMDAWLAAGTTVRVTEFDAIGLPHDLIDVGQPKADPDHVYPLVLTELGFTDSWTHSGT